MANSGGGGEAMGPKSKDVSLMPKKSSQLDKKNISNSNNLRNIGVRENGVKKHIMYVHFN